MAVLCQPDVYLRVGMGGGRAGKEGGLGDPGWEVVVGHRAGGVIPTATWDEGLEFSTRILLGLEALGSPLPSSISPTFCGE